MMEKLKKLGLLISLILAEICPLFFGIIGIVISTVLLLIYIKVVGEHYSLLFWYFIGAILILGGEILSLTMEGSNGYIIGIDDLLYELMHFFGFIIIISCPAALLLLDNFRKNAIIGFVILEIIGLLCFILYIKYYKMNENISKVGYLARELNQIEFLNDVTN